MFFSRFPDSLLLITNSSGQYILVGNVGNQIVKGDNVNRFLFRLHNSFQARDSRVIHIVGAGNQSGGRKSDYLLSLVPLACDSKTSFSDEIPTALET